MSAPDEVKVREAAGVRWVELCRPGSKNGLTPAVNARLITALEGAAADPAVRVVVLTGAGGSFCSGVDLAEAARWGAQGRDEHEATLRGSFHALIRAVRAVPGPVIAAVDGPAVGFGCDLALACDLRLASDRARFGEVFVRRGLMPDGGGTWVLPRLVGLSRALELAFTGDVIDAAAAERYGLVSRVVAADELAAETEALATRLAKGPPLALRLIKQAVYAGLTGTLDEALERELAGQLSCLQSRDFAEGVAAFFAKRAPKFTGT